jgi:hypothetical protein
MHSKIWGKFGWYVLHSTSYMYEPSKKGIYEEFLNLSKIVLPCPICRFHFQQKIEKKGDALESRDKYINWLIEAHNSVNRMYGKKTFNREEVDKIYLNGEGILGVDYKFYFIYFRFIIEEAFNPFKRGKRDVKWFIQYFQKITEVIVREDRVKVPINSLLDVYRLGYYLSNIEFEKFNELVMKIVKKYGNAGKRMTSVDLYSWTINCVNNPEMINKLNP